jgi:hypothetical protein
MMKVTSPMLDIVVKRLNQATGMPLAPYVGHEPQAGNFHLERAYGGVSLHRMCATGTGSSNVFGGYSNNRELYLQIHAMIRGIEFAKQGV